MGKGFLQVRCFAGNHALPVGNIPVQVKSADGRVIHELVSDENGVTEKVPLETYDKNGQAGDGATRPGFYTYDVETPFSGGYMREIIHGVQIFDGITSFLLVQMYPAVETNAPEENTVEIFIPREHGVDMYRGPRSQPYWDKSGEDGNSGAMEAMQMILANDVAVPDYITVHLGAPNAMAQNVRVRFIDYIKNVASSEIFPTWEKAALYANVYAQISFALNRIYTVWYRSRGHDFDITNNTAFDQYFVNGREIFDTINDVVNDIFNVMFLRRPGRREPFFASYCNGTTSTCAGMSQTGSQALALKGYDALRILRTFYPDDIRVVETTNFASGIIGAFPGVSLKEGSSGEDVRTMQIYLNRISGNWYIPPVGVPDGVFGTATKNSVIAFQRLFELSPDGIIGRATWFAITRIYVAAKELAELTSEGEIIGTSEAPPTTTIRQGATGEYVARLQFLLNFVSEFFPAVPFVVQNSVFNEDTKRSVVEFQKAFGLTPDGVVGPGTWRKLYQVHDDIEDTVRIPYPAPSQPGPQRPEFPGSSLKLSSRGEDVSLMQNYLNIVAQVFVSMPILAVDGVFGPSTQAAVAEFQRLHGLVADGVIGSVTWYRILDVYRNITSGQNPGFPGTALRIGSGGNDVRVMQNYLNSLVRVFPSIPSLAVDGVFGAGTQASVVAFQRLFGLNPDGVIGERTWNQIVYAYLSMPSAATPPYPGTALRVGSRGTNVTLMQRYLNTIAGLYPTVPGLAADGVFGEGTKASVTAFQKHFGLADDGVIGMNTWNKIVSVYNTIIMHNSRTASAAAAYTASASSLGGNFGFDKLGLLMAVSMLGGRFGSDGL